MWDEYSELKRQEEELIVAALRMRDNIERLIDRLRKSDHPLRDQKIAELSQLLTKLIF